MRLQIRGHATMPAETWRAIAVTELAVRTLRRPRLLILVMIHHLIDLVVKFTELFGFHTERHLVLPLRAVDVVRSEAAKLLNILCQTAQFFKLGALLGRVSLHVDRARHGTLIAYGTTNGAR